MTHPLYDRMGTSVFERMSLAAAANDAVNLGQGFPDFGWPEQLLQDAAQETLTGYNQYAPSRGMPALRKAVADHYRRHQGLGLDATNVLVTSGATEALAASFLALIEPGDEVVIFAPAYDAYAPMIRRAGGTPVEVSLAAPDFRIDSEKLAAAIGERTKAIVLTNPHNPTGRLFGREELQVVADAARDHNLMVVADEVWERVLLTDAPFLPFASLPGMAERTLKTGSAGKLFSLTGWKVGWLVAPPEWIERVAKAHQFLTFSTPPNLQVAVARGLESDDWIAPMRQGFADAATKILPGLESAGYRVLAPEATYFALIDLKASGIAADDEAFARRAVEEAGVAVVPISPFCMSGRPDHLVRICFAKRDKTLEAGLSAMQRARALYD